MIIWAGNAESWAGHGGVANSPMFKPPLLVNTGDVERVTLYVVDSTRILGNHIVVKHSL